MSRLLWNTVLCKRYVLSATQEEKTSTLLPTDYCLQIPVLLFGPMGCVSEKAPCIVAGSCPWSGRWQERVWGFMSHLEVFSVKALWHITTKPPSREMGMFSNSNWQDRMAEEDAESFWTVTVGETKGFMPISLWAKASSHLEKREECLVT